MHNVFHGYGCGWVHLAIAHMNCWGIWGMCCSRVCFSDGFTSGDFLVDVIVGDCGVGFMGICDGLGGGHVLVWCVIE